MIRLPLVVDADNKYRISLLALCGFGLLYVTTNTWNWRTPQQLPPNQIDSMLPLVPWTIWIYVSFLGVLVSALIVERDRTQLNRFLYAEAGANIVGAIVFIAWPTTFIRPELGDSGNLSNAALGFVWHLDAPVNCLPSLHVSTTLIAALVTWHSRFRFRWLVLLWALAIAVSTMTTKQHHSIDVVAGALVAVLMYGIFFFGVSFGSVSGRETLSSISSV